MVLKRWIIALLLLVPLSTMAQIDDALEEWMQQDVGEEQAAAVADEIMQLAM